MLKKLTKILLFTISFVFLTGFVQVASLIGPSLTIFSSGNVYKAGAQILIDSEIKKKTGKNSLTLVTEEMKKQNNKKNFNEDFRQLVKKRITLGHKKIIKQNNHKEFQKIIEQRVELVHKKLNIENINVKKEKKKNYTKEQTIINKDNYSIVVGTFKYRKNAEKQINLIRSKYPITTSSKESKIVFIEVSGKKLYESRFVNFNKKDAYQACRRLAKYGRDCFVRL